MRLFYYAALFLISLTSLSAQEIFVSGQLAYSPNESFEIKYLANPLIEGSAKTLVVSQTDEAGNFLVSFELEKASIVLFSCVQDELKLYLTPGDSLHINILNRFNIEFSGPGAAKHQLQQDLHLASNRYPYPFNVDDYDLELSLYYLDTLRDYQQRILSETNEVNPDFSTYLETECLGMRHLLLQRLYRRIERSADHSHLLIPIEMELENLPTRNIEHAKLYLLAVLTQLSQQLEGNQVDYFSLNEMLIHIQEQFEGSSHIKRQLVEHLYEVSLSLISNDKEWQEKSKLLEELKKMSSQQLISQFQEQLQQAQNRLALQQIVNQEFAFEAGKMESISNYLEFPLFIYLLEEETDLVDSIRQELKQFVQLNSSFQLLVLTPSSNQIDNGSVVAFENRIFKAQLNNRTWLRFKEKLEHQDFPKLLTFDKDGRLVRQSSRLISGFYLRRP